MLYIVHILFTHYILYLLYPIYSISRVLFIRVLYVCVSHSSVCSSMQFWIIIFTLLKKKSCVCVLRKRKRGHAVTITVGTPFFYHGHGKLLLYIFETVFDCYSTYPPHYTHHHIVCYIYVYL